MPFSVVAMSVKRGGFAKWMSRTWLKNSVFLQLTTVERCVLLLNGSKVGTANPQKKQRCLNCHCKGGGKQRCLNRRQVQRQFTMVVAPPTNGWGSAPATLEIQLHGEAV